MTAVISRYAMRWKSTPTTCTAATPVRVAVEVEVTAQAFIRLFGSPVQAAASGPNTALDLVAQIPAERQAFVFRSLAWLVKLGVLRVL